MLTKKQYFLCGVGGGGEERRTRSLGEEGGVGVETLGLGFLSE